MSKFKVIVPVFNTAACLKHLLTHLGGSDEVALADIIVVDDKSTDDTVPMLNREFPQVAVCEGTGHLYWGGAIRLGMEAALVSKPDFLFWLNHDCLPEKGAFKMLLEVLQDPSVGCVSGFCRLAGYYPHSPGFKNFAPLQLPAGVTLVEADGLNGNFVGFRADAVQKVGLPDPIAFPHHGDGPYTIRFSRAGFRVLVHTGARANLDHELERLLPPFWRVALSSRTTASWLVWYFTSIKSLFHWKYRWNRTFFYRGLLALLSYPSGQCNVLISIFAGAIARFLFSKEKLLQFCLRRRSPDYPAEKLRVELSAGTRS